MKVLVTGANGLLGSHVVRELLNRNYKVRVLVRSGSDFRALNNCDVEYCFGQIDSGKDLAKALVGCQFVIHAAARTAQAPSALQHYRKANVESTREIIKACKKYKVKRMVFVSTANCFGNGSKEKPGNELLPFIPWLKNSGYAYSKLLAQEMVVNEAKNKGLDAIVLNPTFLIGEQDFKPSSGQIFAHALNKRLVFYPPGGKNFVDVELAAQGVVNALTKGKSGECYLLAGENYSYRSFFALVKKLENKRAMFIPLPKFVLLFAGACGCALDKLFGLPVKLTYTNARMLCLGNYFLAQKASEQLDFKIAPIHKSAEKAILWFKSNNYF
jgi:dihydroflavonol-4-reductase